MNPYHYLAASSRPERGDPLFTTNADGPELKLIAQQLTGSNNYSSWSREFRRALVTKGKEAFIDGTYPIPSDERMARLWRLCNQLVRTWLGNCIDPEVADGLSPTEDSKEMWDNIKEMYGKLNPVKLFSITQQISDLKQGNMSIATVYNKLSALWNELEAAEEHFEWPELIQQQYKGMREREKTMRFLLILNESYQTFRSQILTLDPTPSLRRIYQLAVQEESQQQTVDHGRGRDGMVLAARSHFRSTQKSAARGETGFGHSDANPRTFSRTGTNGGEFLQQSDGSDYILPLAASDGPQASHPGGSRGPRSDLTGPNGPHSFSSQRGPDITYGPGSRAFSLAGSEGSYGLHSAQNFQSTAKHYSNAKMAGPKGRGKLYCDYCKRPHHTVENCWKLHGKPGEQEKGKISSAFQVSGPSMDKPINHEQFLMDTTATSGSFTGASYLMNSISKHEWIIDSGASDHIVCNMVLLSDIMKLSSPISVQLPNGNTTKVHITGIVKLSSTITLRNVLYVPDFHFNLLSVARVCRENSCHVVFHSDKCFFHARSTGTLMGLGRVNQGLYFWVDIPQFQFSAVAFNKSLCNSVANDIHHSRLGHSAMSPHMLPFIGFLQNIVAASVVSLRISNHLVTMTPRQIHDGNRPWRLN